MDGADGIERVTVRKYIFPFSFLDIYPDLRKVHFH